MDFLQPSFIFLFLPIFLTVYLISAQKNRIYVLLVSSLLFLAWGQAAALIWISLLMVAGYFSGLIMAQPQRRRLGLFGILIALIVLIFFKWKAVNGFSETWVDSLTKSWEIPLALSYVTFQVISYLSDVWRGNISAERNPFRFAAYLLFFPKLISGPLVSYKNLNLDQLAPNTDEIAKGIRRFLIGFIKRVLIANQLAVLVNAAFKMSSPNYAPEIAWLVLIAYALQIFYDFSGYTDMALGLGLMAGVSLPENFNAPYFAESIRDFWRRWHISLSNWFRDYVFFPLERKRSGRAYLQTINILIVFLLTGMWHGLKPTFITWGLIHGLFIALETVWLGRWINLWWRPLKTIYTLVVVLAGWVFFRSNNMDFAWQFFARLSGNADGITPMVFSNTAPLPFIEPTFLIALSFALIFLFPLNKIGHGLLNKITEYGQGWGLLAQLTADASLAVLFVLSLAFLLGAGFAPNIYASF